MPCFHVKVLSEHWKSGLLPRSTQPLSRNAPRQQGLGALRDDPLRDVTLSDDHQPLFRKWPCAPFLSARKEQDRTQLGITGNIEMKQNTRQVAQDFGPIWIPKPSAKFRTTRLKYPLTQTRSGYVWCHVFAKRSSYTLCASSVVHAEETKNIEIRTWVQWSLIEKLKLTMEIMKCFENLRLF